MTPIIAVSDLTHRFDTRLAVDRLSFEVGGGEVFGLLGPNGAGKTTTVRLLNGLYRPESGRMQVLGYDPVSQGEALRKRTGVLTETPAMYERLTAWQNLEFFAVLADMPAAQRKARIQELLAFFDLQQRARDKVGAYSKGMKQRLALARAILSRPELVFLDEPTAGLDPESAQQVHELILGLRQHDRHTVFLCTHNLTEAERLCDRLGIMNRGRLLAAGTLDELRQLVSPGQWVEINLLAPLAQPAGLEQYAGVMKVQAINAHRLIIQVREQAIIPTLVTALARQGAQIVSVQPRQVSLEEIYFTLQNQNSREGEAQ